MPPEIDLFNADCLEIMENVIPDGSVDLILCDLPYGTTACKWDSIIPFDKLWVSYRKLLKQDGVIVLTASQPFTTVLINSNIAGFRYSWIWNKGRGSNFQNAKYQPMKSHEDICVFSVPRTRYNPQFWFSTPYKVSKGKRAKSIEGLSGGSAATERAESISEDGRRYPLSIIDFTRDGDRVHPTQKPVALMEYLIKTYTNEGMTVMDNCMGSGTTGVACKRLNRNFIGIEKDPGYFAIAEKRINETVAGSGLEVKSDVA